jgi:hypothetical protein
MNKIDAIISRLDKVKYLGTGRYMARCPAHDDRSPSLRVHEVSDGKILIKCFAGCPVDSIVEAIGLNLSDLFPDSVDDYARDKPRVHFGYKSEWFDKLLYESALLSLFLKNSVHAGDIFHLPEEDFARIIKAIETIDEIRRLYDRR